MRYRLIDKNNDMVFGHGGADYLVDTAQTVSQAIFTGLYLLLGEWFLDNTKGLPWLTQVVGRNQKDIYDQIVKAYIKGIQGVVDVSGYTSSLNADSRALTITQATVITIYGTINLQGISIPVGYGQSPYGRVYGG